jgi:hypothetical protein
MRLDLKPVCEEFLILDVLEKSKWKFFGRKSAHWSGEFPSGLEGDTHLYVYFDVYKNKLERRGEKVKVSGAHRYTFVQLSAT